MVPGQWVTARQAREGKKKKKFVHDGYEDDSGLIPAASPAAQFLPAGLRSMSPIPRELNQLLQAALNVIGA